MKDINHPIVGDKKYGSIKNPYRRMMLHANYLKFTHPATKKEIVLENNEPIIFRNIFKKECKNNKID